MLKTPNSAELVRYISTGSTLMNNILVFIILGVVILVAHFTWAKIEMPLSKKRISEKKYPQHLITGAA